MRHPVVTADPGLPSLHVGEAYDEVSGIYDATFKRPIDVVEDEAVRRAVVRSGVLSSRTGQGGPPSVVDLGCGTGLLLDWFPTLVGGYVGIDVSTGMLGKAAEKHPSAAFVNADMRGIRCPRERFDAAVCLFGAVSYAGSPIDGADIVRSLVRPGGRFFIMAYGVKYVGRASYIHDGNRPTAWAWDPVTTRRAFGGRPFTQVRVRGLWPTVLDALNGAPAPIIRPVARVAQTVCARSPSSCFWAVVHGRVS